MADENDSRRTGKRREDELPEIFVFGQYHAVFVSGNRDDFTIGDSRRQFDDRRNIIASGTQDADDREVAARRQAVARVGSSQTAGASRTSSCARMSAA